MLAPSSAGTVYAHTESVQHLGQRSGCACMVHTSLLPHLVCFQLALPQHKKRSQSFAEAGPLTVANSVVFAKHSKETYKTSQIRFCTAADLNLETNVAKRCEIQAAVRRERKEPVPQSEERVAREGLETGEKVRQKGEQSGARNGRR